MALSLFDGRNDEFADAAVAGHVFVEDHGEGVVVLDPTVVHAGAVEEAGLGGGDGGVGAGGQAGVSGAGYGVAVGVEVGEEVAADDLLHACRPEVVVDHADHEVGAAFRTDQHVEHAAEAGAVMRAGQADQVLDFRCPSQPFDQVPCEYPTLAVPDNNDLLRAGSVETWLM